MTTLENEESRPGQRRQSQNQHLADEDTASVHDSLMADRWVAHVVQTISKPDAELCAHCAANKRLHDSTLCHGCLEIGAGDVWSGAA